MSNAAATVESPARKSKMPLILGLILAVAGAAGGFYVAYSGMIDSLLARDGAAGSHDPAPEHGTTAQADTGHGTGASAHGSVNSDSVDFVPLDPITINMGPRGDSRHLRFSAQLEVPAGTEGDVQHLMPRIMDVLNIYLRALDPHELEEPAALLRLRAQMLRRVQIVTGPGAVNDLLVMEFVFN
ncbi:MAG: flagellar basal body-associated FliL family protein [Rhodobacter sp.]|nr:flagellar basal body-associated FliL family protein [Paracoccaceae bacterium]MCC0079048.1 flagellar basal body-associated FliL family protein [Rhodobacter sp.]